MKNRMIPICLTALFLLAACCASPVRAESPPMGGWSEAEMTDEGVLAAAEFAVAVQAESMQAGDSAAPVRLELVKVLRAQQQVVAGVNYRLTLEVRLNGEHQTAEAVVWWQSWREPDPYQLTSWEWQEENRPDQ